MWALGRLLQQRFPKMSIPFGVTEINVEKGLLFSKEKTVLVVFTVTSPTLHDSTIATRVFLDGSTTDVSAPLDCATINNSGCVLPGHFYTDFAVDVQRFNDHFNAVVAGGMFVLAASYAQALTLHPRVTAYANVMSYETFVMFGAMLDKAKDAVYRNTNTLVKFEDRLYFRHNVTGGQEIEILISQTGCHIVRSNIMGNEVEVVEILKAFRRMCYNCGTTANLKLCGGCKRVRFCGLECQKKKHQHHKDACKIVTEQKK
jgi:hypothetical protein